PTSTRLPYTTLFRSEAVNRRRCTDKQTAKSVPGQHRQQRSARRQQKGQCPQARTVCLAADLPEAVADLLASHNLRVAQQRVAERSEEHTSELQSLA